MKKSIVIIILLIAGILIFRNLPEKSNELSTAEKQEQLLKNTTLQNNLKLSKKERFDAGLPPNKYLEEKYLLEINPHTGRTHPENIYKVQQQLKELRKLQRRTPGDAIDNQWTERGPNNVGGRTRMVMYDPNDVSEKRVFAGGVSGGLWVNDDITDVNSSWIQVGIDDNLSVTCMAVDPNDSQIMYIGTGELYNPQQALGNGIWKSTDGGATWNNVYQIRGTTVVSGAIEVPGTYFMTDIIVRDKDGSAATTNDSEVFATIGASFYSSNPISTNIGKTNYGIFKSTDEGASWSQLALDVSGNSVAPNDFELGADNTLWMSTTRNIHGDGGGRVYSSTDGIAFSLKHTITNGRRTEIATSKTNANTVYVLGEVYTLNVSDDEIAPFVSILKTTDAFATTPTSLSLPNDASASIPAADFTRGQPWYNLVLEVDPANDAIAYVGGINMFRTADSGTSWDQISKNFPIGSLPGITVSYMHSDQQSFAFHPTDANIAVIGNDGGVFYASSLSAAPTSDTAIEERTKDYNTTQFYNAAISQTTDPEYIVGGTQDNGILFFDEATSNINEAIKVLRGDGGHCFIDKDGGYMIVSRLYNNIFRYDLPYTGTSVTIASDNTTGSFINARALDENLDILYSNGGNHLARFTDITTATPVRTDITDALITNISAIKVSPFTLASSKVFLGTRTGKVIKVENADTATQTITDISSGSFLGNISSIEFGASEDEIMVTFYNFGVESIWFTEDGGTTWANKEGNFPDINVRCILMNPLNTDEVIVGSELGVWNTSNFRDASPVWNQSYNGMSNVVVTSLSLRTADNTILASTYGRGFYTGQFKDNDLTIWTGNTDSDWTNTNNWSNGLPTSIVDVKITESSNDPIINSAVSVDNISIETNASLTITELGTLTVDENSTNNGTFTINSTIANSGSLIIKGTSTGNIIYNRYVTDKWNLTSAPFLNETYDNDWVSVNSILASTNFITLRAIAPYNNENGNWEYLVAGNSDDFTKGKGFTIKRTTAGNLGFIGEYPENAVDISIDKGTVNAYNLIGNPFPSYLAFNNSADLVNNFLTVNATVLEEPTVYIWDGNDYIPYNHTSDAYLAPGQGFFVISKAAGGTVNFTEILQEHQTATFKKQKQQSRPEIRLFCKNGKVEKYTDILYIDNTTKGFDSGYDSSLFTGVTSNFDVYTKVVNGENDKKLAIQSIPKEYSIVIPVGLKVAKNAEVEFKITSKNIDTDLKIYLEDRKLQIFKFLENEDDIYKFTANEDINDSGRFYIHTSAETLQISDEVLSEVKLFYADKKIRIRNLSAKNNVIIIYDLQGKEVLNQKLNATQNEISVDKLSVGVYIIHLESEKGTLKKKVRIQ